MPEAYYNFNPSNTTWAESMDSSLYDAQVYTVTSMPEGPVIDQFKTDLLSSKSSSSVGIFISDEAKRDVPVIEHLPPRYEEAKAQMPLVEDSKPFDTQLDEPDRSLAIHDDALPSSHIPATQPKNTSFGSVKPEKALERSEPTIVEEDCESGEVSVSTMERFLRFCAVMELPHNEWPL